MLFRSVGFAEAHFAVNRREISGNSVKIGINAAGPKDDEVPVLRVAGADGRVRAVLFGYACHNTTLTGDDNLINGDYAGYAQQGIERENPGATAMFVMLAGADQNPNPRGNVRIAQEHGKSLAAAVNASLRGKLSPLSGKNEKAGLEKGDVIVTLGGKKVNDSRGLQTVVTGLPTGKPVEIEVIRAAKKKKLSVTIEEQPETFGTSKAPKVPE